MARTPLYPPAKAGIELSSLFEASAKTPPEGGVFVLLSPLSFAMPRLVMTHRNRQGLARLHAAARQKPQRTTAPFGAV